MKICHRTAPAAAMLPEQAKLRLCQIRKSDVLSVVRENARLTFRQMQQKVRHCACLFLLPGPPRKTGRLCLAALLISKMPAQALASAILRFTLRSFAGNAGNTSSATKKPGSTPRQNRFELFQQASACPDFRRAVSGCHVCPSGRQPEACRAACPPTA